MKIAEPMPSSDRESVSSKVAAGIGDILGDLIRAVVRQPLKVQVIPSIHGTLLAFVVKTHPDDVRRVIGSRGKHFKALEAISKALAAKYRLEAHLTIDEGNGPVPSIFGKSTSEQFATFHPESLEKITDLLRDLVGMFVDAEDELEIRRADVAKSTVLDIRIKESDFRNVYGSSEMTFDYGLDGNIIGFIKNLFDGIGKNHGRVLKIVINTK